MCIISGYSITFAAAMEYQLDIQGKEAFYASPRKDFTLLMGDSFSTLPDFDFKFDMIFADSPYFLSNGGISLQSGQVVCVDKGEWDKGKTPEEMREWNMDHIADLRILAREEMQDIFACEPMTGGRMPFDMKE